MLALLALAWEQHWLSFEGLRLLAEPLLVVVVLLVLLEDFANLSISGMLMV